jgi:hypothetical protein
MLFMMTSPRKEKIKGSQSMNVTWVEEPLRGEAEKTAASRRT